MVRNQFLFRRQSSFCYSYSMSLRLASKAIQEQAGELSILRMWLKLAILTTDGSVLYSIVQHLPPEDYTIVYWSEEDCVSVVAYNCISKPCPPAVGKLCCVGIRKKFFFQCQQSLF